MFSEKRQPRLLFILWSKVNSRTHQQRGSLPIRASSFHLIGTDRSLVRMRSFHIQCWLTKNWYTFVPNFDQFDLNRWLSPGQFSSPEEKGILLLFHGSLRTLNFADLATYVKLLCIDHNMIRPLWSSRQFYQCEYFNSLLSANHHPVKYYFHHNLPVADLRVTSDNLLKLPFYWQISPNRNKINFTNLIDEITYIVVCGRIWSKFMSIRYDQHCVRIILSSGSYLEQNHSGRQ